MFIKEMTTNIHFWGNNVHCQFSLTLFAIGGKSFYALQILDFIFNVIIQKYLMYSTICFLDGRSELLMSH